MDISTVLNFWKSNKTTTKFSTITTPSDADTVTDSVVSDPLSDTDDDDSFFELELTLLNPDSKAVKIEPEPKKTTSKAPQSPITILRSASPKLRDFMIGKLRWKTHKDDFELESEYSPRRSSSSSSLFTVKFNIEDGSIVPKFADDSNESSKRYSKDVLQKYLSLMKTSFAKSSKTEKTNASPARSTASLPSLKKEESSRFKVKCKHLGKSKSAPAMFVLPLSIPARNDHPVDGIEGAILHCKRSLSSSTSNNYC